MKFLHCKLVKILLLVICCIFALAIAQCRGPVIVIEPAGGFAGGLVIDSLTSSPIVNAMISNDSLFADVWTSTDSSGHYTAFAGTPGIHRWLHCGMEGYITQSKEYSIASDETTMVNFELVPVSR